MATPSVPAFTGSIVAALFVASMPVTVTVAPGKTAPVESTMVITSVPAGAGVCARAVGDETSKTTATTSSAKRIEASLATDFSLLHLNFSFRSGVESPWVDSRVDPEAIESRFFRGFGAGRAADAERQFQTIDVPIIRKEHPLFGSRRVQQVQRVQRVHGCTGCTGAAGAPGARVRRVRRVDAVAPVPSNST